MARPLVPLEIHAPGVLGLNKQGGDGVLPVGWATKAVNMVFNSVGRLASRKGSKDRQLATNYFSGTTTVGHEYIDASNTKTVIYVDDTAIYEESGSGVNDLTNSMNIAPYKFVNFNGWCVGHHPDYAPIVATSSGGNFSLGGGTQYNGDDVLAAWGRLWVLDASANTFYYSDLLINNFTGGSSGSFDLAKYWPNGMDAAIALAEWNDYLVVFGRKSIIIYENPDDPNVSMAIADIIEGIGCIARDSVQQVGSDLVFLSGSGVKSLGRVIQEKSLPQRDISRNVRDYVVSLATSTETIKSLYSEDERFYLLSFKTAGVVMCFDMAQRLEDGSYRATEWTMSVTDMFVLQDRTVVLVVVDGTSSHAHNYTGYLDHVLYDGSGGDTYDINYEGVWNDFGQDIGHREKILKSVTTLIGGTNGDTATVKWAVDYVDDFTTASLSYPKINQAAAGVKRPMTKSGEVVKIGLESTIYGTEKTLKRFNIMAKLGRYV
jgi:hypothetical protein